MKTCSKCKELKPLSHFYARNSKCKECFKSDRRLQYLADTSKEQVYDHYGRMCVCCGETEQAFLTLDHKDNSGAAHRKRVGKGINMYQALVKEGFPDYIQVLCFNCNSGRDINGGICPHQQRAQELMNIGY